MNRGPSSRVPGPLQGSARFWTCALVAAAVSVLSITAANAAPTFVDVTSQVSVTRSGLVFNRVTNTFDTVIKITNTSNSVLGPPLVLLITNLTPATVSVVNKAGQDSSGNPYLSLPVAISGLAPGQTLSNIVVKFNDPNRVSFTFTIIVGFQAGASIAPDGSSIVFKSPTGAALLTVPLVNQTTATPTPAGNETISTAESAIISDDGSHAGVSSSNITTDPGEIEGFPVGSFRYYDSAGLLWQVQAPHAATFFQPLSFLNQRLITPDGSRVLLISVGEGNTHPIFSVYDQSGALLIQTPGRAFDELDQGQLSPGGRYLLAMGAVRVNGVFVGLVRVFDISTQLAFDFQFDVLSAKPIISISSDGRFQIFYQGNQVVLPPS